MKLSVVIPAHDEAGSIAATVRALVEELSREGIDHEILVINDRSADQTQAVLQELTGEYPTFRYLENPPPNGFGFAVRRGLESFSGEAVAVYMADGSDDPGDLVRFYRAMQAQKVDCVFGTRFSRESRVTGYPSFKLALNRLVDLYTAWGKPEELAKYQR